jgi:hypothetical protein
LDGSLIEFGDVLGGYSPGNPLEPPVSGTPRCQRHLLLEDDLHEGPEARRAIPERRWPKAFDDRREMRVAP